MDSGHTTTPACTPERIFGNPDCDNQQANREPFDDPAT